MKRLWAAPLCALSVSSVWARNRLPVTLAGVKTYDGKEGLPAVKAYVAWK